VAGELLKRRREELGLDLKQTADLLKIKEDYLASIEGDRFEKLPVAVYTIGYIRCYATYLQIDPEPIIAFYSGHLIQPKPSTIFPIASSKKKMPFYYYGIPVLVFILLVFGVVMLRQERSEPEKKMATVKPIQLVQPAQTERQQTLPVSETALSQPQAAPPAVSSQATGAQRSQAAGEHSLEIIANDLTWMLIRFSNGKYEELLLRPGMIRSWQFSDKAVLKLGNAGGIRLNLDGRDIGSPGSLGQVMTLVFPENQQINRQGE